MSDTLVIGGTTYTGVAGVKASDNNDNTMVYIRPQGTVSINANGNNIDVAEYETANVSVTPNLQSKSKTYIPTSSQQTETVTADNGYDGLSSVSITVNASTGTSKNAQSHHSTTRGSTTSYSSLNSLTCSKTGTYTVMWTCARTSTSGTWGSQLYIGGVAYGSAQTGSWSNHVQNITLTEVDIDKNDTVAVYGRSRGNSYYIYCGQLTIIEE